MSATSSLPVAIPLRALLPDNPAHTSSSPPTTLLPPLSAVLGPLPSTSPIHLALNFLESSELDEFDSSSSNGGDQVVKRGETVLVVTGPKASWGQEIEAEDEDNLRDKGGRYGTLRHLRKIQTRSCPTADHLKLLLNTLSSTNAQMTSANLPQAPGLVILWDIARLLMVQVETDENMPLEAGEPRPDAWEFRQGVTVSDYLDLIAASKAAVDHYTSLRKDRPRTQLIILEPHLHMISSLPILKTPVAGSKMNTPTREKRIGIKSALEWMLGAGSVAVIEAKDFSEDDEQDYTIRLDGDCGIEKRHCPRASYAVAEPTDEAIETGARVDPGGWRWSWA